MSGVSKKKFRQRLDSEFGVVRGIDFKHVFTVCMMMNGSFSPTHFMLFPEYYHIIVKFLFKS